MSLKTWRQEFYPQNARVAAALGEREALEHSKRKWLGLLRENLKRHHVAVYPEPIYLVEERHKDRVTLGALRNSTLVVPISTSSCALCQRHIGMCSDCSLYEAIGGPCCSSAVPPTGASPFEAFYLDGDAQPMLNFIEEAICKLEGK